jgi:hypothetical protein
MFLSDCSGECTLDDYRKLILISREEAQANILDYYDFLSILKLYFAATSDLLFIPKNTISFL